MKFPFVSFMKQMIIWITKLLQERVMFVDEPNLR